MGVLNSMTPRICINPKLASAAQPGHNIGLPHTKNVPAHLKPSDTDYARRLPHTECALNHLNIISFVLAMLFDIQGGSN